MLDVILAFATIFGPPKMDRHNPNPALACARAVLGKPRDVDTEILAVASYKLPCGARLRVCYGDRCVRARVLDRGPQRAQPDGPRENDIDLSIGLAQALGIGDERGRTTCPDAHKYRGCPITYTVDRYEPPRS